LEPEFRDKQAMTVETRIILENTISYGDIKPVLAKWWHAPEDELKTNKQQIIQELINICGQPDLGNITCFLAGRALVGCRLSVFILDELTATAEKTVRHGQFAKEVKARDGGRCRLTNTKLDTEAAHILDFALCRTDYERYDINNGICLDGAVHRHWDKGRIICVPDCDSLTARFQISEFAGLDSEDREKVLYDLKSPSGIINIPVSEEMLWYISQRYDIDRRRFGGC
jgi:hypothetical protein